MRGIKKPQEISLILGGLICLALVPKLPYLEPEAIVRAVMGHWLFGFIHPSMDGNGRKARFLMNLVMASGGYPWTIVRMARRKQYLDALEFASADQKITPFAKFIREEMSVGWRHEVPRK
jgi:fido (protein-threonine AMPylation protein)